MYNRCTRARILTPVLCMCMYMRVYGHGCVRAHARARAPVHSHAARTRHRLPDGARPSPGRESPPPTVRAVKLSLSHARVWRWCADKIRHSTDCARFRGFSSSVSPTRRERTPTGARRRGRSRGLPRLSMYGPRLNFKLLHYTRSLKFRRGRSRGLPRLSMHGPRLNFKHYTRSFKCMRGRSRGPPRRAR